MMHQTLRTGHVECVVKLVKSQLVNGLIGSSDSGTSVFSENIDRLNAIWNKPQDILFDKDGIYFVPQAG